MKPKLILNNGDPVATASGSDTASRTSSFDFLCKGKKKCLLFSLVCCLLAPGFAMAQIGGPVKTKTRDKKTDHAAPKTADSVSQRFESAGIAVDFSVTATPDEEGKSWAWWPAQTP